MAAPSVTLRSRVCIRSALVPFLLYSDKGTQQRHGENEAAHRDEWRVAGNQRESEGDNCHRHVRDTYLPASHLLTFQDQWRLCCPEEPARWWRQEQTKLDQTEHVPEPGGGV
jgi:hypothetical protein